MPVFVCKVLKNSNLARTHLAVKLQSNVTNEKILENGKKILENSGKSHGNLSVRKCGNHDNRPLIFTMQEMFLCFQLLVLVASW